MKKKIRYIINPHSGASKKHQFPELIRKFTDNRLIEAEICFTEAPRHATELSREAAAKNYFAAVAVGGDGSLNETAAGLIGSPTAVGIIPAGSGNGMARHQKVPMDTEGAIRIINQARVARVDTFRVDDHFGIGTFGVGFDAHVAHLFAKAGTRGYSTYVKLVLGEFYKYRPRPLILNMDGKLIQCAPFLLTFANSSQFGNNAVIAPFADVHDGLLEVSKMDPFPLHHAPHLIWRLMHNTVNRSKHFEGFRARTVHIRSHEPIEGHIDGEPLVFGKEVNVNIVPSSLDFIVP